MTWQPFDPEEESTRGIDACEVDVTAWAVSRDGAPESIYKAAMADAVVSHLAFAFQHLEKPRELLERYRRLAKDAPLQARLRADFGARPLNRSCAAAPPAAQRQGRRPPPVGRAAGGGKGRGGAGIGRSAGGGAAPARALRRVSRR